MLKYGLVKLVAIIRLISEKKVTLPVLIKEFTGIAENIDHVKFAAMFALMNGTYKATLCLLRNLLSNYLR